MHVSDTVLALVTGGLGFPNNTANMVHGVQEYPAGLTRHCVLKDLGMID
jgi:hypothetical protein